MSNKPDDRTCKTCERRYWRDARFARWLDTKTGLNYAKTMIRTTTRIARSGSVMDGYSCRVCGAYIEIKRMERK